MGGGYSHYHSNQHKEISAWDIFVFKKGGVWLSLWVQLWVFYSIPLVWSTLLCANIVLFLPCLWNDLKSAAVILEGSPFQLWITSASQGLLGFCMHLSIFLLLWWLPLELKGNYIEPIDCLWQCRWGLNLFFKLKSSQGKKKTRKQQQNLGDGSWFYLFHQLKNLESIQG